MSAFYTRLLAAGLLCTSVTAFAQEPSVRLESRVTGNRELPKVTYILPWRQPAEVDFSWTPEPGIAADLFQPLRRDEYRRRLQYQNIPAERADSARSAEANNQKERGN